MHRPVLAFASIVFTTLVVGVLFAVECSTPALAANQDLLDKAKAAIAISGIQCDLADAREISLTNESAPNSSRGGRRGGGMGGGGMGGGSRGGGSRFDDDSGGGIAMAKPGAQRTAIYEVACHEGLGFVVILGPSGPSGAANSDGAPSQAPAVSDAPKILAEPFNCLELEESPDKLARKLRCQLDANKDQSHGLESLVASVNITCPITARHSLGHTEKASFFEIACQNGEGYILTTSRALRFDQTVRAIPCYSVPPDAGMSCTLTDVAGTLQALKEFVSTKTQDCLPVAQRLVGISSVGNMVFEVGCQSGVAYMVRRTQSNSFDTLTACTEKAISNSCKLTNLTAR